MTDQPRVNKTKEQLVAEMKQKADFQKKMAFIKEKFWPALCKASANVEEGEMLLEGFNTAVMQAFLGKMKETNIKDLGLGAKLDATSDKFLENRDLLALFSEMSVFDSKDYIEGMRNEIALFKRDEFKTRTLESLQVKWIDELK